MLSQTTLGPTIHPCVLLLVVRHRLSLEVSLTLLGRGQWCNAVPL